VEIVQGVRYRRGRSGRRALWRCALTARWAKRGAV